METLFVLCFVIFLQAYQGFLHLQEPFFEAGQELLSFQAQQAVLDLLNMA